MFRHAASATALFTGAQFCTVTALTVLSPLLVDMAREFGTTVPIVGQLTAATSIPWAVAAPLIGPLSDRYGRRPVLLAGMFGVGLTTTAVAVAPNLPTIVALRFLTGCAGAAAAPTILASVGDLFHGPARTRAFGWVNGGWAFAAIAGVPLIAAVAGASHWRVAFAVVGCATVALVLPLSRLALAPPRSGAPGYVASYATLLRQRPIWLVLGINALERALYSGAATYLPALLIQRYDLPLSALAPILALTAVGGLAGNLAGARAGGPMSPARLVALCQVGAGGLAILAFAPDPGLVLVGALMWSFGAVNAVSRPTFLTLVTDVGAAARGSMLGILATSNQAGFALGAAVGGLALALGGYAGLGVTIALSGLAAASVALALDHALRAAAKTGD